jgi:uncharacterized membrane protein
MNKILNHIGLYTVYLGVMILVISVICGWSKYNIPLFLGILFICIGIILHVVIQKKQSKY